MTRKPHFKKKIGRPRARRKLAVWAEHRDPVDIDRFVAVLVTLALRRIEEEEADEQAEATDG
jgi:hypothetical protein